MLLWNNFCISQFWKRNIPQRAMCQVTCTSYLRKKQFEWLKMIMVWEVWYDRNHDRTMVLFDLCYQSALSIRTNAIQFLAEIQQARFWYSCREKRGKGGCLRAEELLSNCCPARPLFTKPPIKHYRDYQEAVDHFHGFARATLIQHALILRSYILTRYVFIHGIITI